MKYEERIITVKESTILDGHNLHTVAKLVGCSVPYLSLLRRGKRVATPEFYAKLESVLTNR